MSKPSAYRLLCTLTSLLSFGLAFGQNSATIRGQVVDKEREEAIIAAYVILLDDSGEIITGAATDVEGNYSFNVDWSDLDKEGQLSIRVSYVGYIDETVEVNLKPGKVYSMNFELVYRHYDIGPPIVLPNPWTFRNHSGEVFDQEDIKTNYRQ